MSPIASIVIPAYNEGAVIGRCLAAALGTAEPGEFEVVVACNGCTDDTAAVARAFPSSSVLVVETPVPGKPGALNLADARASAFPRIYLDADVEVSTDTLRSVVDTLRAGPALAAAPRLAIDIAGASALVRAYYRVWTRLAYTQDALIGAGFYAVSEEGRRRFDEFPPIIADDMFVREHFATGERATAPGTFVVRPPRKVAALTRVRIRRMLGNIEYAERYGGGAFGREPQGYRSLVARQPSLLPSLGVYFTVQVVARIAARRRMRGGDMEWLRDASSRVEGRD